MRIATWNMGFRDYSALHDLAWDFVFNQLAPDVFLAQEAVLPHAIPEGYSKPLWTKAWDKWPWGSAILSRVGALSMTHEDRGDNRVQIAHGVLREIGPTCVANIHSRTDGLVIPRLTTTMQTVVAHRGDRFIVGGDFNTGRIAPPEWVDHTEFWGKVDGEWGFHEPRPFGLGERQSFWREWEADVPPTAGNSLQDDHVLLDRDSFSAAPECIIWDTKRVRGLSDHGPVVVDLAFDGVS